MRIDADKSSDILLLSWVGLAALFVIVLSPFMAARHYVMIVPAILLILGRRALPATGWPWRYGALAATAALGALLGVSDWLYADAYRTEARWIRSEWPDARIWCVGHWGWQYYAQKAGMQVYDAERSVLERGDLVVMPQLAHRQAIPPGERCRLEVCGKKEVPVSAGTRFRTMAVRPRGGYYSFWLTSLPWTITAQPLETFTVYVVGP